MNVRWLRPAIADVERLVAYALASEAKRAPFLADRLASAAGSLARFPERGRPIGRTGKIRQLIVRILDDRYLLQYRVEPDATIVLRVWHGREGRL